jgi:hypothetical protein
VFSCLSQVALYFPVSIGCTSVFFILLIFKIHVYDNVLNTLVVAKDHRQFSGEGKGCL